MPVLKNPKHERLAQELAKGSNVADAIICSGVSLKRCGEASGYYVYILIDPRDWSVFYVGKGIKKRAFAHEKEWKSKKIINPDKHNRIGAIKAAGRSIVARCLVDGLNEADAFDTERWLIRAIGLKNLTNASPGSRSETARNIIEIKDTLKRFRPFCRWRDSVLWQFDPVKDCPHEKMIATYWECIGHLSEMLAKLEGRPYRKFARIHELPL